MSFMKVLLLCRFRNWISFTLNGIAILVQTPIEAGSSGGRKTSKRIILVCHGSTQMSAEVSHNEFKVHCKVFGHNPLNSLNQPIGSI